MVDLLLLLGESCFAFRGDTRPLSLSRYNHTSLLDV